MNRWIPTVALALFAAGVGLAPAAGKADDYTNDKTKTAKTALKPSVSGKLDAVGLARLIDAAIDDRLAAEKIQASPQADDAEFLRRVYLDLAGHIPTAAQAAAFLDDNDPAKRSKAIDELLAGDDFGKHMADVWGHLLLKRTSDNRFAKFDVLVEWLTKRFNDGAPWDKMVADLVAAEGTQDDNGAVVYTLANPGVDKMTDSVTKSFLGVRLQCAQCHNHPFTDRKQTEYWGMADFFKKVQLTGPRNPAQQGGSPGIEEGGKQGRPLPLPDSAKRASPKFLGGPEVRLDAAEKARPVLVKWLTAADNPFFSKAMANRVWGDLFGRGIVNPIDDMIDENTPSHPQLLVDLADQFAANGFDVKYLYRAVCNSRAYQRSSKPAAGNDDADPALYARMPIKVMTPEQQFDSLSMVNAPGKDPRAVAVDKDKAPKGPAARFGNFTPRNQFVAFFEVEDGDSTEYQAGIPQALRLMNAPQLNNAGVLNAVLKTEKTPNQIVEHLYLTALSRRPTEAEQTRLTDYVAKHKGGERAAYSDVLWALVNSSEFVTNH
jgi:hypothetical protein